MRKFITAGVIAGAALAAAGCSSAATRSTAGPEPHNTAVTAKPAPSVRPSASESQEPAKVPTIRPGQTVSWTWDNLGVSEKYRWTLTKAKNLGADSSDSKYDVEALYLTITNTGRGTEEADPLASIVWTGEDGKVDQTVGGTAALNDAVYQQTGTDITLNSDLAPGQYEQGYMDVDVDNSEPGVLAMVGTDGDNGTVPADTLIVNYDSLTNVHPEG